MNIQELKALTTIDDLEALEQRYIFSKIAHYVSYRRPSFRSMVPKDNILDPQYYLSLAYQNKYKKEIKELKERLSQSYEILQETINPKMYRIALGEEGDASTEEINNAFSHLVEKHYGEAKIFYIKSEVAKELYTNLIKRYHKEEFFINILTEYIRCRMDEDFVKELRDNYPQLYPKVREALWESSSKDVAFVAAYGKKFFPEFKERLSLAQARAYFYENKKSTFGEDLIKRLMALFPELIKEVGFAQNSFDIEEDFSRRKTEFFTLRIKLDDDYDFMGLKSFIKDKRVSLESIHRGISNNEEFIKKNYNKLKGNDIKAICRNLFDRDDREICKIFRDNLMVDNNYCLSFRHIYALQYLLRDLKMTPAVVYSFVKKANKKQDGLYRGLYQFKTESKTRSRLAALDTYRLLIDYYGEQRFLKLLQSEYSDYAYNAPDIKDISRMYKEIKKYYDIKLPKKPKSFREIHNHVAKVYRLMVREMKSYNNNLNQWEIRKLDGLLFGDYRIQVAKTDWELVETGEQLRHCVASYVKKVRHKGSFIFNLYKEGSKLDCCVEMNRDWRIIQAKGMSNKRLDAEVRQQLEKVLKEMKPSVAKRVLDSGLATVQSTLALVYYGVLKPLVMYPVKGIKRLFKNK